MAYHVEDVVKTGDPLSICVTDTGDTEDSGRIDSYTSDTNPLLHDLKPHHEFDTTTDMELAAADAEKHVEIGLTGRGLAFEFGNVADILELRFGFTKIGTSLTTKTTENVAGFFFAANLDEPTRGFGKGPDDGEEEEKRNDLESDGKSPDER